MSKSVGNGILILLAGCNFVVGSGAMSITGLIAPVAHDLQVPPSSAAQLLTAYAVAIALSAPLVAVLASRVCRKVLLVWSLAGFGLLMLCGALAQDYSQLWVARAATGVSAAAFVPNASAIAATLSFPSDRGKALSVVFGGFTLALVLGAPLGTYVGVVYGWRVTLAALGFAALFLALAASLRMPGEIIVPGATLKVFREVLQRSRLLFLMLVNAISAFGTFVVFSLASIAFPSLLGTTAQQVAKALLVFGLGALVGNAVSGRWLDRLGAVHMSTAAFAATALALAMLASGTVNGLAWAALTAWGVANFVGTTAMQTRLVAGAPELVSALLPLNSSAQFAGQSLGAAVGGLWLLHHPQSIAGLAWIGCASLAVASLASWFHGTWPPHLGSSHSSGSLNIR